MTVLAVTSTDEMVETRLRRPLEAAYVLALRVRQETGWGAHGTSNCCYEHAEQNL
jgi:hypothetical protein